MTRRGRDAVLALWALARFRGHEAADRLAALGGVWMKLGQVAALRRDLFPAHVCRALRRLLGERGADGVVTASVATVTRAELDNGAPVAIKAIKTGAVEQFGADVRLLRWLAWAVGWLPVLRRLMLRDLALELDQMCREELDLRIEAEHMRTMRRRLRAHGSDLRVCRVYGHLSTERRLVMEWLNGVVLGDVLDLPADTRDVYLALVGAERIKLAQSLLDVLLWMVFELNRFHTDMHKRNLMLVDGRLWLIDWGSTSATDAGFLTQFGAFIRAVAARDYSRAAVKFSMLCLWPGGPLWTTGRRMRRLASVRRDLVRVISAWATRASVPALPFADKSLDRLASDMMTVVLQAGGSLQWQFLRLTRAISTAEGNIGDLWPEVNYMRELDRYLAVAARRESLVPVGPTAVANALGRILAEVDDSVKIAGARENVQGILDGNL